MTVKNLDAGTRVLAIALAITPVLWASGADAWNPFKKARKATDEIQKFLDEADSLKSTAKKWIGDGDSTATVPSTDPSAVPGSDNWDDDPFLSDSELPHDDEVPAEPEQSSEPNQTVPMVRAVRPVVNCHDCSGVVGETVMLKCQVEDVSGRPIVGVPVIMSVTDAAGRHDLDVVSTDSSGTARVHYTIDVAFKPGSKVASKRVRFRAKLNGTEKLLPGSGEAVLVARR